MSEVMGPEVLGHSGAQKRQCPSAWSLGRKQRGNSQIEAGWRPEGEGFPRERSPRRTGSSRPAASQEQGPSQGPGARHRRAAHKLQRAKEGGPRRWVGTRPPRALRQHRPEGWKGPWPEARLPGPSEKGAPPSCPNYPCGNRLREVSQVPTLRSSGIGSLPPPPMPFYRQSTDTPGKVRGGQRRC